MSRKFADGALRNSHIYGQWERVEEEVQIGEAEKMISELGGL